MKTFDRIRRAWRVLAIAGFACIVDCAIAASAGVGTIVEYKGICDASAAAQLDDSRFVVANDEDSVLRIYARETPGPPLATVDLAAFLGARKRTEADIEGAARIGERIYWITSHGASGAGKPRPERQRLFVTQTHVDGDRIAIVPIGRPHTNLLRALLDAPSLRPFGLDRAARIGPEEPGGLNIEGLGATPQGALLIGFRNPVPAGKALVVPLLNPAEVVDGRPARLGEPILLGLGGNGIRGIDYEAATKTYLILAGMPGDGGAFHLYRWSGSASEQPALIQHVDFAALHPEALVIYDGPRRGVQVLSDDGGVSIGGVRCKDAPESAKRFRSVEIAP